MATKKTAPKKAAPASSNGFTFPAELALFRREQDKSESCFFLDSSYGEVTLVDGTPDGVHHYMSTANGDVWERMFAEIAWVGEEADGGLLGYWKKATGAPVIYLDNEGQFVVTGPTLVDHFAWARTIHEGDEGDEADDLVAFSKRSKLPPPKRGKDRSAALQGVPDPNKRFASLEKAARAPTKARSAAAPAVRPVDRYPILVRLRDDTILVVSSEDDVTERDYEKGEGNVAFVFDPSTTHFRQVAGTPFRTYLTGKSPGTLEDGRAAIVDLGNESRVLTFDPKTEKWTEGPVQKGRHDHAAVGLLQGGRVLLAGGERSYPYRSSATSIWDSAEEQWTTWAEMPSERSGGFFICRGGGAMIVGGEIKGENYPEASDICERFHTKDGGTWTTEKPLPVKMSRPYGFALPDGRTFVASPSDGWAIWDPTKEHWSAHQEAKDTCALGVLLTDGRVAFFGAGDDYTGQTVLVLDIATKTITKGGTTRLPRLRGGAERLPDGRVLLVGGDLFDNIANEPEIWDPKTGEGAALPGLEKALEKQEKNLAKNREKKRKR